VNQHSILDIVARLHKFLQLAIGASVAPLGPGRSQEVAAQFSGTADVSKHSPTRVRLAELTLARTFGLKSSHLCPA
jgi:hypothetical protein